MVHSLLIDSILMFLVFYVPLILQDREMAEGRVRKGYEGSWCILKVLTYIILERLKKICQNNYIRSHTQQFMGGLRYLNKQSNIDSNQKHWK